MPVGSTAKLRGKHGKHGLLRPMQLNLHAPWWSPRPNVITFVRLTFALVLGLNARM